MKLYRLRNPEDLVTALFTQPFTKVNQLVDSGIYTENTARDYLNRLCDIRVLEKKRNRGPSLLFESELYRILSE